MGSKHFWVDGPAFEQACNDIEKKQMIEEQKHINTPIKICRINDIGFEMIRDWVIETRGEDDAGPYYLADDRAIEYWCQDAEKSLNAGNPAMIEMPARSTNSGQNEIFVVPDDGISIIELED